MSETTNKGLVTANAAVGLASGIVGLGLGLFQLGILIKGVIDQRKAAKQAQVDQEDPE